MVELPKTLGDLEDPQLIKAWECFLIKRNATSCPVSKKAALFDEFKVKYSSQIIAILQKSRTTRLSSSSKAKTSKTYVHAEFNLDFLSDVDRNFLIKYGFSSDDVLDALDMSGKERNKKMGVLGKTFAFGKDCPRCEKEGKGITNLKVKSGHCIYCYPSSVTFAKQRKEDGYIYIAGSISKRLIKIGSTKSLSGRSESINHERYAGTKDWVIISHSELLKEAGVLEAKIHFALKKHAVVIPWNKWGVSTYTRETFKCSFVLAEESVKKFTSLKKVVFPTVAYDFI